VVQRPLVRFKWCEQQLTGNGQLPHRISSDHLLAARLLLRVDRHADFEECALLDLIILTTKAGVRSQCMSHMQFVQLRLAFFLPTGCSSAQIARCVVAVDQGRGSSGQ
jgi:hypothetical protein